MVQISPLVFKKDEQKVPKRDMGAVFLTVIKNQLTSSLKKIFSENTLKVQVTNDSEQIELLREVSSQFKRFASLLSQSSGKNLTQSIQLKTNDLVTLNKDIEGILKRIEETVKRIEYRKIKFPDIQKVSGEVKVLNPQQQYPFDKIVSAINDLKVAFRDIRVNYPDIKQPDIKFPEFPKNVGLAEAKGIIDALKDLKEEIKALPKNIPKTEMPEGMRVHVENFPPQKYPLPVTNFNMNPLRGSVHQTTTSVTTSLTTLPGYGVLDNRRAIIFYNNDSTKTLYVGGSTVTTSNGLPIPPKSFSPSFDSGPRQLWYGVSDTGSIDVRCIELQNDSGN